jgi:uroporphyrinogen decarboxylase
MELSHRDRILGAIRHQPVDRLPTDIWATPEVMQRLYTHFKVDNNTDLFDCLGIDGIFGIAPPYIGPEHPAEEGYRVDEWGMGYRMQVYPTGAYEEQVTFPLAQAATIDDLKRFAWPSPDWYDYSALPAMAERYPDRAISCGYTAIFYWHNRLRGLEQSLIDPLAEPEITHYIIDRVTEFFLEYHRRCYEAARGKIDITQVTDDFGSQNGLLISPRVFDACYRPGMQQAIDLAKSFDILVFHHDDGDNRRLLPRLVQMGIDVLNPIQWRCGNWDLDALKTEFGGQICFHGGVDNQETLPFKSPDDVCAEVRRLKQTLGRDGTGYIIAPCHNIQPNTSIENIIALYQTAAE